MAKQNFLLVSLEEEQSKQLAEVLNNSTSRKIIEYLSEREDATESDIAKGLGVPISTVHYNLQKLKEAQLVNVEEFHYSKKGREVDHYRLANKYVIITPKPVKGIRSALRSILPVSVIVLGIAALIQFAQMFTSRSLGAVQELSKTNAETLEMASTQIIADSAGISIAVWFLVGAFTAIILFIIVNIIIRRLKK